MEVFGDLATAIQPYMGSVFLILAVFTRMSVFLFLVPTYGERTISTRTRLVTALMLTWLLLPTVLIGARPDMSSLGAVMEVFAKESIFGAFLGLGLRLMIFVLQIAGNIISQMMSISQPLGEGIATEPNPTLSSAFMLAGVTILVTLDFHIEAFRVLRQSYDVFPLGAVPNMDSFAYQLTMTVTQLFKITLSLAFPFILLNFIYNLLLGFVNRAMPQLLVSFVGMPAMIWIGMILLAISFGAILLLWVGYAENQTASLLDL